MPRRKKQSSAHSPPPKSPAPERVVPDWTREQAVEAYQGMTPVQKKGVLSVLYALLARAEDSPRSFAAFYYLVHGNPLPEHCWEEIEHIYRAKGKDRAALLFAFRGSWKTTTISVTFMAYRIGKEPKRANLLIQANDDSANDNTGAIAKIIEYNPGWKMVFPNIAPDKERGWGNSGYEVKRTDIPYSRWIKQNSSRRDPTLMGLGIRSKSLIGRHPDGVLMLDDIHDEENTSSDRERNNVINKVTGTILPFIVENAGKKQGQRMVTWTLVVGTPWTDDDAYHYLKNTGEFEFLSIPAMKRCEEGEGLEFTSEDTDKGDLWGYWKLKWGERFDKAVVLSWRNRTTKREFARMFLLDLAASKETGIKYQSFPADNIDPKWLYCAGVDYASIRDRLASTKDRCYFALAWGAKIPTGGMVITGGVFGHFTQAQADMKIEQIQNTFVNFRTTVIEDDGKGEEYIHTLQMKPHLRITPLRTMGIAKHKRQEGGLAVLLELGIVRVSDGNSEFLNLLRKALEDYPDGNEDVRDAAYWLCRAFPELWNLPSQDDLGERPMQPRKRNNPFARLGRM